MKKLPDKLYGWYDSPEQEVEKPTYNPPMICLFCVKKIPIDECRTVSVMGIASDKSFFYRVHKKCHEKATDNEIINYESSIIDNYQNTNTP